MNLGKIFFVGAFLKKGKAGVILLSFFFLQPLSAEMNLDLNFKKMAQNSPLIQKSIKQPLFSFFQKKASPVFQIAKAEKTTKIIETQMNKKQIKITQNRETSSYLDKEDVLPLDYNKRKNHPKVLKEKLKTYLNAIEFFCPGGKDSALLKEKIKKLYQFLETEIQDPYMDSNLEILFKNILDVIGDTSLKQFQLEVENFRRRYLLAFNLPEDTDISKYPHKWAVQIEKGLNCLEKSK